MKHDDAATPPPPAASSLFRPDRLPLAERYAELLATDGVVRGLIGPREAPRLWDRHLLNCALLATALPPEATVADVGSGAGLPGIVLAIARPDLRITLVEPLLRRTTFLDEVVAELGLDGVTVVRGRADALHGTQTFDVVTSRAVAPLDRLLGWSMPLVAPEGALVAMKGSSVAEEIEAARAVLEQLGCAPPEVQQLVPPTAADVQPIQVVRVTWADPSRVSFASRGPVEKRRSRGGRAEQARRKKRKS